MRVICAWCSRQYAEKCPVCGYRVSGRLGEMCAECGHNVANDHESHGICPECATKAKQELAGGDEAVPGEKDSHLTDTGHHEKVTP